MKKNSLLSIAIAATLLSACSGSEEIADGGNTLPAEGTPGEMTVALNFGRNVRATGSYYADGKDNESEVRSARFYFYNATSGDFLGVSDGAPVVQTPENNQTTIESQVSVEVPVSAIDALRNDPDTKVKVVAVLNEHTSLTTPNEGDNKVDGLLSAANTVEVTADGTDLGFMMTNSVYSEDATTADAKFTETPNNVQIDATKVYRKGTTPTANQKVTMYVERVCAKVTLTANSSYETDAKDATITFNGWGLNVLNTKYYGVKHLAGIFDGLTTPANAFKGVTWNKKEDWRSFWAKDPNYSDADGNNYLSDFTKVTFSTLTKKSTEAMYCLENTFTSAHQNRNETTTAVVLAQFKLNEAGEGADWVYYNRNKFTVDNFLKAVVGAENPVLAANKYYFKKADSDNPTALGTGQFELKAVNADGSAATEVKVGEDNAAKVIGYTAPKKIVFTNDVVIVGTLNEQGDFVAATDKNAVLAEILTGVNEYQVFVGGYCYYEIPIRHFTEGEVGLDEDNINTTSQLGRYGIVRNNAYQLTVNSINGIGKPITGETIEPDNTPDDVLESAIDVTINVLPWATHTQDVDL